MSYSGYTDSLTQIMHVHHIVAAVLCYMCFYIQGMPAVVTVLSLVLEVSTIFINLKWLLFEFKLGETAIYELNKICFFFSYLFARIIFQSFLSFGFIYPEFYRMWQVSSKENLVAQNFNPSLYWICFFSLITINGLSQLLNLHWFRQIL